MVLLHLLYRLSLQEGWRLTVAHLNHSLRGRSSKADERFVRRAAAQLKLPIIVERADVREFARTRHVSVEMAARKSRHDFLARAAVKSKAPSIALAHHADDQLELFFLRLLRGTSGEGLAGMRWAGSSPSNPRVELVRPLLDQPKAALLGYAAEEAIPFREDETNALGDIQRNRIRHELLPLLRKKYQPALDKTVLRLMDLVGAEADSAAQAASAWLQRARDAARAARGQKTGAPPSTDKRRNRGGAMPVSQPVDQTALCSSQVIHQLALPSSQRVNQPARHPSRLIDELPANYDALPIALQRRCIQAQLLDLGIAPDFELVERLRRRAGQPVSVYSGNVQTSTSSHVRTTEKRVLAFEEGASTEPTEPSAQVRTRAGSTPRPRFVVRDTSGLLHLRTIAPQDFNGHCSNVALQGRAGRLHFEDVQIQWQISSTKQTKWPAKRAGQECFDADRIGAQVRLRHWRQGDRYQPIGMKSAVKLQDIFTNQKVPRARRHRLLVAETAGGDVFWVEGMRISERFKVARQTIRLLQWRWQRL
jgi:tRNA(Ile)-lysidine synthetase-like protein